MRLALPLVLAAVASAQQVWTLDSTAAPGALDALVNDPRVVTGDIVRIRSGAFGAVTINGKGLHLIADQRASVEGLTIQNVPAPVPVSVVSLDIFPPAGTGTDSPALLIRQCGAGVFLSRCEVALRQERPSNPAIANRATVLVERATLHADDCRFMGRPGADSTALGDFLPSAGLRVDQGAATLAWCWVWGGPGASNLVNGNRWVGQDAEPPIVAASSLVHCVKGTLWASNGGPGGTVCAEGRPAPAIRLLCGDAIVAGGVMYGAYPPGCPTAPPVVLVDGCGTLTLHPTAYLSLWPGTQVSAPPVATTTRRFSALIAWQPRTPPGQVAYFDHFADPGTLAFTLVGTRLWQVLSPSTLPGGLFLDPQGALVTGPLWVNGSGHVQINFAVPNTPVLAGARVFLQTVGVDAQLAPLGSTISALLVAFP